jgi:hypothetical protein
MEFESLFLPNFSTQDYMLLSTVPQAVLYVPPL